MTRTFDLSYNQRIFLFLIAICIGALTAINPNLSLLVTTLIFIATLILYEKDIWKYGVLIPLFGLSLWSYGFNNIPLIRPLPLVDALAWFAVLSSLPLWWKLTKFPLVKKFLVLLTLLTVVAIIRIIIDTPKYGLLAPRDALFVFELWTIFPAMLLGYNYGEKKFERFIGIFFLISILWFLLYPVREFIISISPIVGIQRPVPLFTFTTAGFLSVPAFFWFLSRKGLLSVFGTSSALFIMLMVQSRGVYIAFILAVILSIIIRPRLISRWKYFSISVILILLILFSIGNTLTGRLGASVGFDTVVEQLATLLGKEGLGAGSFQHRLTAWPMVIQQVLSNPFGPIVGLGLGLDLFQGFTVGPGVLVRKPHNDFLEIWARLGIVGFIPWLGILFMAFKISLKGAIKDTKNLWVLALQFTLLVASMGQPAMGFAYITLVWVTLTGLWIGSRLKTGELL